MKTWAAYTDEGIWATGDTAEEAIVNMLADANATLEEYEEINGPPRVLPMSDSLAAYVEAHGFDCNHDRFTEYYDHLDVASDE